MFNFSNLQWHILFLFIKPCLSTHTQPPLVVGCLSLCALLCSSALPTSPSPSLSLVREIRHLQQFFLSSGGIQLWRLSLSDFLVAGISIKEFLLPGDVAAWLCAWQANLLFVLCHLMGGERGFCGSGHPQWAGLDWGSPQGSTPQVFEALSTQGLGLRGGLWGAQLLAHPFLFRSSYSLCLTKLSIKCHSPVSAGCRLENLVGIPSRLVLDWTEPHI